MPAEAARKTEDQEQEYYGKLADLGLLPFWFVKKKLVTMEPTTDTQPFIWRMADIRESLLQLGDYVDVKTAERRGLMMENPGLPGTSAITNSMLATFQLITPGEIEDSHRHVASAWRFIIEGEGAHTTVEGEKCYLSPGDVVVTPSMTWHEHGNETPDPVYWVDGLDIPLVNHFGASFKGLIDGPHEITRPLGDGRARYGSGALPYNLGATAASPLMHYPYSQVREALEQMRRTDEWDAYHGLKVRYTNPTNGEDVFPTLGLNLQLLPAGFKTLRYRSTEEVVCVVSEGRGRTVIGDTEIQWEPKDVFVIPSWHFYSHEPSEDAVIFTASDRPAQEKLGLWQQQHENEPLPFS